MKISHIVLLSTVLIGSGYFWYMKQKPNARIIINPDGSGEVILGNESLTFKKDIYSLGMRGSFGYSLSLNVADMYYELSRFGKTMSSGKITKYDNGSDSIEIIHKS